MTEQTRPDPTSTEPGTADRFRVELREWLARELTAEVAAAGGKAPDEGDLELLRDWNRRLADAGWAAPAWPAEHGGRGADIDEQLAYLEEMSAVSAPGPLNVIGVSNIAPAIMAYGTDGAAGAVPAPDAAGRRDLVPGDVRARRRERPGLAPHQCGGRRRRLRGQRPEDLEQPRPDGRLVPTVRADRSRRPQAQGDQLPPGRSADTRDRHPAGSDDHRRAAVQRALLRRRPCAPRRPARARCTRDGRWP